MNPNIHIQALGNDGKLIHAECSHEFYLKSNAACTLGCHAFRNNKHACKITKHAQFAATSRYFLT